MTTPTHIVTLALEGVTHASWAPFGSLPSDENTEHDTADLEFSWNDGHVNFIGHTNDELTFTEAGLPICELLNRHDTHTQTLMPFSGPAYVVVAPRDVDFSNPDHFTTVRAFHLPRHAVVHLARGTWHWGPYPIGSDAVRIFNIQGRGYARDNGIAWLTRDHSVGYAIEGVARP